MLGHLKIRTYNLADRLHKADYVRNVVFVDEFTGTGETIASRVVGERFKQAWQRRACILCVSCCRDG